MLQLLDARPDLEVDWVVLTAPAERADEASASAERFLTGAGVSRVRIESFGSATSRISRRAEGVVRRPWAGDRSRPGVVPLGRRRPPGPSHRSELVGNTFRDQLVLEYEIPKFDGDLGRPSVYVHLEERHAEGKLAGIIEGFPARSGVSGSPRRPSGRCSGCVGSRAAPPRAGRSVPLQEVGAVMTLAQTDRADVVAADLAVMGDDLEAVFSAMSGERLLITGGAGFLGYYLVQAPLAWNASQPREVSDLGDGVRQLLPRCPRLAGRARGT